MDRETLEYLADERMDLVALGCPVVEHTDPAALMHSSDHRTGQLALVHQEVAHTDPGWLSVGLAVAAFLASVRKGRRALPT